MGKREILSRCAYGAGFFSLMRAIRAGSFKEVPVLAYHRVLDIPGDEAYPFDEWLVSCSVSEFEWQMKYVSRHYTPISFSTLAGVLYHGENLPKRPIIISFDDGYDDNYHNAYPVLKRLGIPATIFLSTGYIGTRDPFWFDWVVWMIKNSPLTMGELAAKIKEHADIIPDNEGDSIPTSSREEFADALLEAMKVIPNQLRLALISTIEESTTSSKEAAGYAFCKALGWDQVREMSNDGIEFGSHTVTHPILTMLDDVSLSRELEQSRKHIEQETGLPCTTLAYPVGRPFAFDDRVIQAAKSAGYTLGVSYISGSNPVPGVDAFRLKRLHVELETRRHDFVTALAFQELV